MSRKSSVETVSKAGQRGFLKREDGVVVPAGKCTVRLAWYGPGVVRVRAWPGTPDQEPAERSLMVVAKPVANVPFAVKEGSGGVVMQGGNVAVRVGAKDGRVSFADKSGKVLLAEGAREFAANGLPLPEEDGTAAQQDFIVPAGVAVYGLGQFPREDLNLRGKRVELQQANRIIAMPFISTTGGWGMLWDSAALTVYEDDAKRMRMWSQVADAVDYYVCLGDANAITAGCRLLTGRAAMLPRWAYGFWQSKERYSRAEELVQIVEEYRRRGVGLDVIVQDWAYWGPFEAYTRWNAIDYDRETYGDLPAATARVHKNNARVMISVWPSFGTETEAYRLLVRKGLLFYIVPSWPGCVHFYDAFSKEAQDIYWRQLRDKLLANGVDGWWMDATEPEMFGDSIVPQFHRHNVLCEKPTAAGSWSRVLNAYSLASTGGVYGGQRRDSPDRRVCILTRSGFPGQQRNGAISWSGDVGASWWTLRNQVRAGLGFAMAGHPYWTTDNGAFFVGGHGAQFPGGVNDPAYREFYLRWQQWSVCCPVMRSHGTETPREIWRFGEKGQPVYDALADTVRLRYRLLPYLYSVAGAVVHEDGDFMRGLGMAFPGDARTHDVGDQFMFGPALMALPVTHPVEYEPLYSVEPARKEALIDAAGRSGALTLRIFQRDKQVYEGPFDVTRWPEGYTHLGDRVRIERCRVEIAGSLRAEHAGRHRLSIQGAGEMRVEINGELAYEGIVKQGSAVPYFDRQMNLVAGQTVPIRILHGGKNGGSSMLILSWSEPQNRPADALGAPERFAYLPAGTSWHDFYTGARQEGGRAITVPTPIAYMPLLVRSGSIVPMGPELQWTGEKPADPLEVRVYPGADGAFALYEDSGEGYGYENGECSRIGMAWDDEKRTLTIGARQGRFPGMSERRSLRVVVVKPGYSVGVDACKRCDAEVRYDGRRQVVCLKS